MITTVNDTQREWCFNLKAFDNCLQDKECCESSRIMELLGQNQKSVQVLGTENNQDKQKFHEPRQGITSVSLDQT